MATLSAGSLPVGSYVARTDPAAATGPPALTDGIPPGALGSAVATVAIPLDGRITPPAPSLREPTSGSTSAPPSRPLYSSRCARVGVVCRGLFSFVQAGICLTGYGCTTYLCKKERAASRFASLGSYYLDRGKFSIASVGLFGDRLVAVSVNAPSEPVRAVDTEKLHQQFTHAKESVRIADHSFSQEELEKADWKEGICAGISMDFISEYFVAMRGSSSPHECLLTVAGKYTLGGPQKAVHAQYLGSALEFSFFHTASNQLVNRRGLFLAQSALYDNVYLQGITQIRVAGNLCDSRNLTALTTFMQEAPDGIYHITIIGTVKDRYQRFLGSDFGHAAVYNKSTTRAIEGRRGTRDVDGSFIYDANLGALAISQNHVAGFSRWVNFYNIFNQIDQAVFCRATDSPVGITTGHTAADKLLS